MGNSESSQALAVADKNNKNLERLALRLKEARQEAEIQALESKNELLKCKEEMSKAMFLVAEESNKRQMEMSKAMHLVAEESNKREIAMIKEVSLLREEAAKTAREQREFYERLLMGLVIVFFAIWYFNQKTITIESGSQALRRYEY